MGETGAVEPDGARVSDAAREPSLDAARPRALGHDDEAWCEGDAAKVTLPLPSHRSAQARVLAREDNRARCNRDCAGCGRHSLRDDSALRSSPPAISAPRAGVVSAAAQNPRPP